MTLIGAGTRLIPRTGEECPTGRGIRVDVGAAVDVVGKAHPTSRVATAAPREIRISPVIDIRNPGRRRGLLYVVALVVVGLRLQQGDKDVVGIAQVKLLTSLESVIAE